MEVLLRSKNNGGMRSLSKLCSNCLLLVFMLFPTASRTAYADVEILTTDGRVLRGEIDERSNERLLWVRHDSERIQLTTSVRWEKVAEISIDGTKVEESFAKEDLLKISTKAPQGMLAEYEVRRNPAVKLAHHVVYQSQPEGHVVSIEADAYLVNFDRDVEPDGFELAIAAFDDRGLQVPVRGNLYVELWGQRSELHGSPIRFEELQRWSESIRHEDFIDGTAIVPLKFRSVRPEFDFKLWPEALIKVRLGVPGEGNFATTAPVMLRQWSPFRDRLQIYEGSRFLPNELSENVRREYRQVIGLGQGIRSR